MQPVTAHNLKFSLTLILKRDFLSNQGLERTSRRGGMNFQALENFKKENRYEYWSIFVD
jgi:hypothetical protein